MVYNIFNKESSDGAIKKEIMQNEKLPKKLYKLIIWKFEKRKVHLSL